MARSRAFTIVELLVVMAIIMLLITLTLFGTSALRNRSVVMKDLNNMRQLQLAHVSYSGDNRGRFIDVGLPHGNLGDEDVAWINTLEEYYVDPDVIRSPLDTSPHWPRERGGDGVSLDDQGNIFRRTSYGCNNYLTQYSPIWLVEGWRHERLSQVNNPAATVHFLIMAYEEPAGADSETQGFPGADHVHVEQWGQGASPPDQAAIMSQIDAADPRTSGGPSFDDRSNYSFLDGHVETLRFSEVYVTPRTGQPPGAPEVNRFDPRVSASFALQTDANRPDGGTP